ncbi:transglutaminase TgpA family protein [Paeniglutamicibacter antarcticus]|uniref:DUF3488 and transglutaminase-like domain-containing protein n=1 Tax=Paeniglutamicibacter antarcticus TaxID=494023 RepID=A0ABP9TPG9_9MICC
MSAPTLSKPRDPDPEQAPPARSGKTLPLKPAGFAVLATLVAVLGSVASLHGVISGWDWMFQASVVVAGIVLSTNVVRVFSARRYLATMAGAIVAVLLLTTLFFSATAWLGVFPTTSTYDALLRVWALANDQMGSQVPPVQTTGVIIFSVCIWAAAVALAVDTLAFELRAAALAGLPLAMLLSIAALFKAHGAGPATLSITAVGYLLVLAASRLQANGSRGPKRRALELGEAGRDPGTPLPGKRQASRALLQGTVLVAGALAALLVLPAAIPGFTKGMLPEGKRPAWGQLATNIDPMIALGNDLRSRSRGTVLRYFTDSKTPTYLRTSVIGGLASARWEPDPEIFRFPVTENLATLSFPTVVESNPQVFTRVVTDKYRGVWMPLPENSIWLNGLDDSWRWSPDTGTLRAAENATPTAEDYTVLSVKPDITSATLKDLSARIPSGYFAQVDEQYLALPEDTPDSLRQATKDAVSKAGNDHYEQAVAIQDYLRSTVFTYSEKTPVEDGYDGSGMHVIDAFLEEKAGYCVHFASTMALMARELEIPSRLVTGYAPGTPTGVEITGQEGAKLTEFTVGSRNAHAWPELYFPSVGWVGFEPTPGRGVPPVYAPALPAPTATALEDPRLDNPRNSSKDSSPSDTSSSTAAAAPGSGPDANSPAPGLLRILLVLLVAGALPWTFRRIQRANRLTRMRQSAGPESGAAAAWAELIALGIDNSCPMRHNESAGDYARRVSRTRPLTREPLLVLAGAYERMRYSPGRPHADPESLAAALDEVKNRFTVGFGPEERLGRALWPRSLFAPRPLKAVGYVSSD